MASHECIWHDMESPGWGMKGSHAGKSKIASRGWLATTHQRSLCAAQTSFNCTTHSKTRYPRCLSASRCCRTNKFDLAGTTHSTVRIGAWKDGPVCKRPAQCWISSLSYHLDVQPTIRLTRDTCHKVEGRWLPNSATNAGTPGWMDWWRWARRGIHSTAAWSLKPANSRPKEEPPRPAQISTKAGTESTQQSHRTEWTFQAQAHLTTDLKSDNVFLRELTWQGARHTQSNVLAPLHRRWCQSILGTIWVQTIQHPCAMHPIGRKPLQNSHPNIS